MSAEEDVRLSLACATGDAEAFAALYKKYASDVARVVASRIRDASTAEDVVHDVFTRAYLAIGDLRDPSRLRPWLMAIARNACMDEHRRQNYFTPLSEEQLEQPDDQPSADDLSDLRELAGSVRGCVAGLSRRDATALAMVVQLGMTVAELAGALGVSHGAAKVIIHRARRRLGEALVVSVLANAGGGCERLNEMLAEHEFVKATLHAGECPACGVRSN